MCIRDRDTYVYQLGNISVSVTPPAFAGHALFSTIVNITFDPTVGVELFTALVTDRSACGVGAWVTFKIAVHVFCNQFVFITVIVKVYVQILFGVMYVVHTFVFTKCGNAHATNGETYIYVGITNAQLIVHETDANHQLKMLFGLTLNVQVGADTVTGVTVADAWSSSVGIWLFGVESGSGLSDVVTSIVFT